MTPRFTPWQAYSQRERDGTYVVYGGGPLSPQRKPRVPPRGGRYELSTDGCWLEVLNEGGEVLAVYFRYPERGRASAARR